MSAHSLGEFQELILLIVAALRDDAYGVSILKQLELETQRNYNVSAVHMALKRMEKKGYLTSKYGGITTERGGRRKKYYSITAAGRKMLDHQYELRTRIYKKIQKISFN